MASLRKAAACRMKFIDRQFITRPSSRWAWLCRNQSIPDEVFKRRFQSTLRHGKAFLAMERGVGLNLRSALKQATVRLGVYGIPINCKLQKWVQKCLFGLLDGTNQWADLFAKSLLPEWLMLSNYKQWVISHQEREGDKEWEWEKELEKERQSGEVRDRKTNK